MKTILPKFSAMLLCCAALALLSGCTTMDANGEQAKAAARDAQAAADAGGAPLHLARAARDVGDYGAAINLYKNMVKANPEDTDTVVELGETQLQAGLIDDAVATFQTVPATSKSALGAQLGMERADLMQSQPAKALECADKAIALDAKNIRALVGRGVALDMLGRHAEAQSAYRSVIATTPNDIAARSDLALSLAMSGQFDEAIALMTPLARSTTATPRLRQNLALIYGLKGDSTSARALSRVDLDAATTSDNLKFFTMVRANAPK